MSQSIFLKVNVQYTLKFTIELFINCNITSPLCAVKLSLRILLKTGPGHNRVTLILVFTFSLLRVPRYPYKRQKYKLH